MTIELELCLEGEDANEDTLLDLIDWLERANIEGLTIMRKELPHTKGDMGELTDPTTIITVVSTGLTLADIAINVVNWRKNKDITINPVLKNSDEVSKEKEAEIQATLAKMKSKVHKNK